MYLKGSKWHTSKKRRRSKPWRVLFLLVLVVGVVYFWQFYVPEIEILVGPTPTPTRSPALYIIEAESFFQAGKLGQAEEAYLQAIAIEPREINYHLDLARVRVFAGDYAAAETAARDALLINPDSAIAHAVLGWALDFRAGEASLNVGEQNDLLAAALTEVERAYELNPSSALVLAFYSEVVIDNNINDYEQALDLAQRSIELGPELLETHRAVGYVWERTGNYTQAVGAYETAKSINPNLPRLHIDIGNMLQAQGDTIGAVESYKDAIALAPENVEPLQRIAQAYARIGEYGKASQFAKDAVGLEPTNARLRGDLGRMYYHNNVLDDAVIQLELAIRGGSNENGEWVDGLPLAEPGQAPDDRVVEFYYTYGLALAKLERCEEAVPIFQALLQGVPDNEIAVFNAEEGLIICGELAPKPTPDENTDSESEL